MGKILVKSTTYFLPLDLLASFKIQLNCSRTQCDTFIQFREARGVSFYCQAKPRVLLLLLLLLLVAVVLQVNCDAFIMLIRSRLIENNHHFMFTGTIEKRSPAEISSFSFSLYGRSIEVAIGVASQATQTSTTNSG